ncbi:hypothetical protein ACFRMQ_26435 [Kitasatospora sp. NPDC056783]|uniref:hypothetical protein n=1 Tax=Kitasatospora sp. NPDC056783 TaxID=3345943 RepID=UPI00367CBA74
MSPDRADRTWGSSGGRAPGAPGLREALAARLGLLVHARRTAVRPIGPRTP